jgi:hypothetical protein
MEDVIRLAGGPAALYTPDLLYRSLVYGSPAAPPAVRALALPRQPLEAPLRPGDAIVRVALGEPGLGRVAVLTDGRLLTRAEAMARRATLECESPGRYAIVAESGGRPAGGLALLARLVTDARGVVPAGQIIVRVDPAAEGAASAPDTAAFVDEPAPEAEAAPPGQAIHVVDDKDQPLTDGEYAFLQDAVVERGKLDAHGRAVLTRIDPTQAFMFEIRDRVCVIRAGAFLDPDDMRIEYGGTCFDWALVRDDTDPDKNFWPYYRQEMDDVAQAGMESLGRGGVQRFLQHEHITRRPIRVAKPFLRRLSEVRIRALPAQLRTGPLVRYTDHERAVIWVETVTPTMVRVRYRTRGAAATSTRYSATVRVGGRYFAAVELDGLAEDTVHDYTLELAPLPASGPIPVGQRELDGVFPTLTPKVEGALKAQLSGAALTDGSEWLTFRTLRRRYDRQLRFATGSCRWYPGDKSGGKDWGPDMLHGLGDWLRAAPREQWPHFLFFGGDQIYADEIGDGHAEALVRGRFGARIPGPGDATPSARDKLVDGAWAGRFAHRYKSYKDPDTKLVQGVRDALENLDEIHRRYPDIKGIYREYPDKDPAAQLRVRYETLRGKRQISGARGEDPEERKAREALALLPTVEKLEISAEPLRAFLPHWRAGFSTALRRNPMSSRFLCHNFLLWELPPFQHELPALADRPGPVVVRRADARGHPAVAGGVHAGDFAEYAFLYERAWTTSRSVRVLLAQVPTFLMLDDHEVTDDWNFDASWVRMIHSRKDEFRMWPKTLSDALVAYWMYQGWCNKAPSQWSDTDPRIAALIHARRTGTDALPRLRQSIHGACFMPEPSRDSGGHYQTGLSLDWHYQLPFDPPFLVPDCRTRKLMVPADDRLRIIDHETPAQAPRSQTIDDAQLAWMRTTLLARGAGGPIAFIATSTPLLLQHKLMSIMTKPEIAARLWAGGIDASSIVAGVAGSARAAIASDALLRLFRVRKDLEHMVRDKSWRDIWGLLDAVRRAGRPLKTMVIVSGDVHHNYCMTANLPGGGRPTPEVLQITCSGLQTTIRKDWTTWLGEKQSDLSFSVGKYRLVPGFMSRQGGGAPDLVLYQNAAALVDVTLMGEVQVRVDYLSGKEVHTYRYTSGPAYMVDGEPAASPWSRTSRPPARRDGDEADPDLSPLSVGDERREGLPEPVDDWPLQELADVASEEVELAGTDATGEGEPLGEAETAASEQSSLEPGQSITVDGENIRTYRDAIAWYTSRRDVLQAQRQAFVTERYAPPPGLDDLIVAANARIGAMGKLGTQPLGDSHVEGLLGWLDTYVKVMSDVDLKMETIAAERFRATRAEVERIVEQAARLQPQLRDLQRSAFRKSSTSTLKKTAETLALALDSTLVAKEWVRNAGTTLEDIRVLGTTLRTQKALHGSPRPWHEVMRETTNARVSKLLSVADRLNKAVAVWQLLDAGLAVLSGGKTSSDRASAGVALTATTASAMGTLLGASGFFSLYNNLYIGPMVKRILGQIEDLKDRISVGVNQPLIQLGRLDDVDWRLEPGGRVMYEFMRRVMQTRAAAEIGAIPASVGAFFSKYQRDFDAGTPKRHGVELDYADFRDKRDWVFGFRDDIWGMLYGSMPVP